MAPWIPQVPIVVNLRRLFPLASFVGCGDIRTMYATDRSTECRPGALFAVMRGHRADGHVYIQDALQRGASSLLVEYPLADVPLPQCVVPDVRRAYAEICASLWDHPARKLGLVGVTGTNGKTTVTYLIRSILATAGKQTGLLGTVEYSDGLRSEPASLTTPDPKTLARWLHDMVASGASHAVMEVSSHALDQRRVSALLYDAAIITNITQDHFDYHHTFEAYQTSKLKLLDHLRPSGLAIINVDDPGSRDCLHRRPVRTQTYGLEHDADITAHILDESLQGTRFRLVAGTESCDVETHLIGRHNVSNCLAAAAATLHCGITLAEVAEGIQALRAVPGRMEHVENSSQFEVFVDYAHTPDALQRCLQFLEQLTPGRVICVFGAGGDRDRTKRPLMGHTVARLADVALVTSDNPRSEPPEHIIQEILAGIPSDTPCQLITEPDRERAIHQALQMACPGDAVLIAGKGHETEQIVGPKRIHFDDREVARLWFNPQEIPGRPPHAWMRNRLTTSHSPFLTD